MTSTDKPTPTPTPTQHRFMAAIADNGGVSANAMHLVGGRRLIRGCESNGWVAEEPKEGGHPGQIQHRLLAAGYQALGREMPAGHLGVRLITITCQDFMCYARATTVVAWKPLGSAGLNKAFCQTHADNWREVVANHLPKTAPIAEGTQTFVADGEGTQVGTCRHCGHYIYLYFSVAGREGNWWRESQWDETGRCGDAEQRTGGWMVWHEPATTVEDRDAALAATVCGRSEQHAMGDCRPAGQAAAGPAAT
ncbi:hypothetical protein [Micromonospora craterilacus]|nr:hypothetical protein [Micromonospora craterilacus]